MLVLVMRQLGLMLVLVDMSQVMRSWRAAALFLDLVHFADWLVGLENKFQLVALLLQPLDFLLKFAPFSFQLLRFLFGRKKEKY